MPDSDDEAVSPVVAVILLVAVTVALSAAVGAFALDLGQQTTDAGDTQSAVRTVETGDGVSVKAISVESPLEVRYDGVTVDTINPSEVGSEVVVPAAPGETVTIVATGDGKSKVVASHTVSTNSNLLAYYRLDGTPNDSSGNGLHAENVRLNETRPGLVDKSYNFTGGKNLTQSELRLPRSLFGEFRTVCFAVNPSKIKSTMPGADGTTWDDHNIFHDNGNNNANDEYGWHLYNDSTVSVGYGAEGYTKHVMTYRGIPENAWTFMCHTIGDEKMRLYVNGSEVNSTATHDGALNYNETGKRPLFGRHVPDLNDADGLYGKLDEVRFYREALSGEQIRMLYESINNSS